MSPKKPTTVHPAPADWLARALATAEPAAARRLERHARACDSCRSLDEAAQVLTRAAAPGMFEPVPRAARRRAEAAFASIRGPATRAGTGRTGRLRVVWSAPFVERSAVAMAPGMRGTAADYRCSLGGGPHRIDLEWLPEGGAWQLRGRIVSETGHDAPGLILEPAGAAPRRIIPGERGFFGPLRMARPELRVRIETELRTFLSPWMPGTPRARPAPVRKPRG